MIIADSLAAYDAQHPTPRPMEADCKTVPGKMPGAPKSIVLCATHGHVIDEAKGQIVANTPRLYYRAHPAAPTPAPSPTGTAKPTAPSSPDQSVGSLQLSLDAENDIERVIVGVNVRASGDLEYSMSWNYADSPAVEPPKSVQEQIVLTNDMSDDLGTVSGAKHAMEPGKSYGLKGKRKLKLVDGGFVHVDAKILANGMDRPLLALSGEFKITLTG